MAIKSAWLPGHPLWHSLAYITKVFMANPGLHTIDQVPEMFKELFILSGYRSPTSSPWQCIASIFERNNETFNFWTHFLPSIYFWWRTLMLWPVLVSQGAYAYPMMTYLISIAIFPFTSAVAHIFNTMSVRARHICFFMDYAALGFYVLGVAIAYHAYTFPAYMLDSWYADQYLHISAVFSIIALISACYSRFLPCGVCKKVLRMTGFSVPYFFVSAPYLARILQCEGSECHWTALFYLKSHFFFAFLSAFLFASHMPERFFPGKFDFIGHSHQLFHLFSVLASNQQMNALLQDMKRRRHLLLQHDALSSPDTSFRLFASVVIVSILVVLIFIYKLKYFIPNQYKVDKLWQDQNGEYKCDNNNAVPWNKGKPD